MERLTKEEKDKKQVMQEIENRKNDNITRELGQHDRKYILLIPVNKNNVLFYMFNQGMKIPLNQLGAYLNTEEISWIRDDIENGRMKLVITLDNITKKIYRETHRLQQDGVPINLQDIKRIIDKRRSRNIIKEIKVKADKEIIPLRTLIQRFPNRKEEIINIQWDKIDQAPAEDRLDEEQNEGNKDFLNVMAKEARKRFKGKQKRLMEEVMHKRVAKREDPPGSYLIYEQLSLNWTRHFPNLEKREWPDHFVLENTGELVIQFQKN